MSSDALVPKTAVPDGIEDPVKAAQAELFAALNAIADKVNVPKQVSKKTDKLKALAKRKPAVVVAGVVGVAAVVGLAVWGIARTLSR